MSKTALGSSQGPGPEPGPLYHLEWDESRLLRGVRRRGQSPEGLPIIVNLAPHRLPTALANVVILIPGREDKEEFFPDRLGPAAVRAEKA
jgi:hypothetical protein